MLEALRLRLSSSGWDLTPDLSSCRICGSRIQAAWPNPRQRQRPKSHKVRPAELKCIDCECPSCNSFFGVKSKLPACRLPCFNDKEVSYCFFYSRQLWKGDGSLGWMGRSHANRGWSNQTGGVHEDLGVLLWLEPQGCQISKGTPCRLCRDWLPESGHGCCDMFRLAAERSLPNENSHFW